MFTFAMYQNKEKQRGKNLFQIELAAYDYADYVNNKNVKLWDNLADLFCDMEAGKSAPPLVEKRTNLCTEKLQELEANPHSKLTFMELLQSIFWLTELLQETGPAFSIFSFTKPHRTDKSAFIRV